MCPLDDEDEDGEATSSLLPRPPISAQVAQHNHTPSANHYGAPDPSSINDARPKRSPGTLDLLVNANESRWKTFARASAYPPESPERGEHVTEEWLQEHGPDYSRPWHAGVADAEKGSSKAKRRAWWKRFQRTILRNPMVPLVIRLTLWTLSLIAMALGISIHVLAERARVRQGPSAVMAIAVDAVALVYILYITYDEYTGKPLGLRSAKAKMRLIFLDLFFIVFGSANLSSAFQALSDPQEPCRSSMVDGTLSPRDPPICRRQTALASVLFVALIAWLMTFSISVLR